MEGEQYVSTCNFVPTKPDNSILFNLIYYFWLAKLIKRNQLLRANALILDSRSSSIVSTEVAVATGYIRCCGDVDSYLSGWRLHSGSSDHAQRKKHTQKKNK